MKKKKRGLTRLSLALTLALGVALTLTSCGSSGYSEAATDTVAAAYQYDGGIGYDSDDLYSYSGGTGTEPAEVEAAAEENGMAYQEEGISAQTPEVQDNSRKLIRNVNLEAETETFDDLINTIWDKTEKLGGYIEDSYTYNGSSYYGQSSRNANLTIRIPANQLDSFLSSVAEVSNIISRNESVTDVTLQYVDMESHKKVLLAEQERLMELLGKAETVEDIISLESRLSEVRYQIESMEAQLRTLDNQVSYSTVYLSINEVKKLTPVKEQTAWEKISTGFVNSLYGVGNEIENFVINLIIDLPYLVAWAVVIIAVVLIVRAIVRYRRKKRGTEEKIGEKRFSLRRKKEAAAVSNGMERETDKQEEE
ncbi:MAG: DUF4349 domain-containing protein [Clostridium sp.]|nr:DUF4349 domain-containing protein [Clostridium sp.]